MSQIKQGDVLCLISQLPAELEFVLHIIHAMTLSQFQDYFYGKRPNKNRSSLFIFKIFKRK